MRILNRLLACQNYTVKNKHIIHLRQEIGIKLERDVLFPFYNQQVLQFVMYRR